MKLTLPAVCAVDLRRNDDIVRQLLTPATTIEGTAVSYTHHKTKGVVFQPSSNPADELLIIDKKIPGPSEFSRSVRVATLPDTHAPEFDCSKETWLKHPHSEQFKTFEQLEGLAKQVLDSWKGAFYYLKGDVTNHLPGLRNPQIGALHMIMGHWSVSDEVGTIVMPTGTGKTETMLSLLVAVPCPRILVVVPTDALRTQIGRKFLTLGILKTAKVVGQDTLLSRSRAS